MGNLESAKSAALGPVAPTTRTFPANELARVRAFFDGRKDLRPTPLRPMPMLARELGIGGILVKDESSRFGLPAFKVVGVTYAVHRLMEEGRLRPGDRVVCATAGNHGRAVARVAREQGLRATVYVPAGTVQARIDAIAGEGADVIVHDRGYDSSVQTMAREASRSGWTIVSDTTWPVDEAQASYLHEASYHTPQLIMAGYTRIFDEAASVWDAPPEAMFIQAGVGSLLAAAAGWAVDKSIDVVSCEPVNAACVLAAASAGQPCILDGSLDTTLAGLRCAEVSHAAWPIIAGNVKAFVTVTDEQAYDAMRAAASEGIVAGPSGAGGLAAVSAVLRTSALAVVRDHLTIGPRTRVLVVDTEGNTDPALYERIVGGGLSSSYAP